MRNLHPRIQLTDPVKPWRARLIVLKKPTDRQDPDPENPTEGHPLVVPWAAFRLAVSFGRFVSSAVSRVPDIWWDCQVCQKHHFFRNLWDVKFVEYPGKYFES